MSRCFAFAAIDGFFPVVPSESLVITAGVFAANGEPLLPLVIVAAAAGAFAGDHIAYLAGRTAGDRLVTRLKPGSKRRLAFDRAGGVLDDRGGLIIVVCRYIPGARTAITMTAGAVRLPAALLLLLRRHRGRLLGRVLGPDRLPRRRRLRERPAQGPRPRARCGADHHRGGRGRPRTCAPARRALPSPSAPERLSAVPPSPPRQQNGRDAPMRVPPAGHCRWWVRCAPGGTGRARPARSPKRQSSLPWPPLSSAAVSSPPWPPWSSPAGSSLPRAGRPCRRRPGRRCRALAAVVVAGRVVAADAQAALVVARRDRRCRRAGRPCRRRGRGRALVRGLVVAAAPAAALVVGLRGLLVVGLGGLSSPRHARARGCRRRRCRRRRGRGVVSPLSSRPPRLPPPPDARR